METSTEPNAALRRLDKLVGTWTLVGRTLDSKEDNIKGKVTIEWILDGFYLQQRGIIEIKDMTVESIEILGFDPTTDIFPAWVYGKMGSMPIAYYWDVQGKTVTHGPRDQSMSVISATMENCSQAAGDQKEKRKVLVLPMTRP